MNVLRIGLLFSLTAMLACKAGLRTDEEGVSDKLAPIFDGIEILKVSPSGSPVMTWASATDELAKPFDITYAVYRSTEALEHDWGSPIAKVEGQLSFTDLTATMGQRYYYVVRAGDKGDNYDNNQKELDVIAGPPVKFSGVQTVTAVSDTHVELTWDTATGGVGQMSYRVYLNGNFGSPVAITSERKVLIGGLQASTIYTFIVRAADSVLGEEKNEIGITAITLPDLYPDYNGIKTLTVSPGIDGTNSLVASWNAATPPPTRAIANYNVYVSAFPGAQNYATPTFQTLLTNFTITGLTQGQEYHVVVRAQDDASFEEKNTMEMSATTDTIQPISFVGLGTASKGVGSAGFDTVILSWTPGTGSFDEYEIYMSATPGGQNFAAAPLKTVPASDSGVTLTAADGISGDNNYYFVVRAHYSVTDADDGNTVEKQVTTTPNPPAFAGIVSAAVAPGADGLDSVDIAFNSAVGVFNKYRVFIRYPNNSDGTENFDFSLNGGSTDYANSIASLSSAETTKRITGLTQDEDVCFAVRAVWQDGVNFLEDNQAAIAEACATPTLSPPVFGGAITAAKAPTSPDDKTEVDVSWNAATGVYDQYIVYAGDSAAKALALAADDLEPCPGTIATCRFVASSTDLSYRVTGLPPGVTSYFVVKAKYTVSGAKDVNTSVVSETTADLGGKLVWEVQPTGGVPGNMMPVQPKVSLRDLADVLITNVSMTVTATIVSGDGTLTNETANISSGYAQFTGLTYTDADSNAPTNFTITIDAPGVTSTPVSLVASNAQGPCRLEDTDWRTADGGCKHLPTGLVMSIESSANMTWYDAIASNFDGYENSPAGYPDTTPNSGYCYDLVENGYSDWRLPTTADFFAMTNWHTKYAIVIGEHYKHTTKTHTNVHQSMKCSNSTGPCHGNYHDKDTAHANTSTICIRN